MMEAGELTCTVTIEELQHTGEVIKKTLHRNLTLALGRDSFSDLVLRVSHSKKTDKYPLKEVLIHKKFVKDGKATVKLPDHKVQFLLCNCPPDKLIVFLKTLSTKLECLRDKGFTSMRKKLLSDIPVSFQEISPLTVKDLQTAQACKVKQKENNVPPVISKGGIKRKRTVDTEVVNQTSSQSVVVFKKQRSETLLNMKPSLSVLNKEQTAVLEAVLQRKNIFFTGSAGTGKTFLMKRIIGALPPQHTFATASTGVAACQIGGTTVHAFAGIGSGQAAIQQCIELASRPQITQQWKKCHHLIIDEISMVDGEFFDKLETVARVVRQNDEPFGGIQLIMCGDFLQLPPVTKDDKKRKFCFQSRAWHKCIQINLELQEVRRQSDKHFIDILQHIRHGRCPEHVVTTLKATAKNVIHRNGIQATRLCTHKEDVEEINKHHLHKLTGETHTFVATDSDSVYTKQLDNLCPVKGHLVLKSGAQVILAKNLDVQKGLVNGARGVITGFEQGNEGFPVVKFVCGVEEVIKPVRWAMKAGSGLCLMRKQIPLKLAWAISIHKSQGMSLDCVEISLSRVFESGQAYVALSRARSLQGLRVIDFDKSCVRANPEVLKFYHKLNLTQRMLQSHMGDFQLPVAPTRSTHW
ncbi:ATP-dependent DNA helicase PIF1-like [Gigantopelta aegis]|uniref:ATP-dependent DNA helicase PIF1-like n=1 Tax=Gigantopelta aegis TaxID=1735272 RepID=UPI001B88AB4A|nr:ATP-dependent DNA helicase PIF1-like [Gigantopelta aegis]XP_041359902.1 ATP-dependent DNA helicase PIF1-like [Gigantopelta aegis]